MLKLVHTCDICKKEVESTRLPMPIIIEKDNGISIAIQELDVCPDCLKQLVKLQLVNGRYVISELIDKDNQYDENIPYATDKAADNVEEMDVSKLAK